MTQSVLDEMRSMVAAWDDAINSGDVDATLDLYLDDESLSMPPHVPTGTGKAGIRQVIEELHAQGKLTVHDELLDAAVWGDDAVTRGSFTLTIVTDSGETIDDTGKWVCLCKRVPDGSWKIVYNIWNSDNPMPE